MNNEEKILLLLEKMDKRITSMEDGQKAERKLTELIAEKVMTMEEKLGRVEKSVMLIENDHGRKLDALFDGYKQNAEKLTRIEEEVSKHEEIILRRVR
ncbi:MAG: hypothetical protein PHZ11_08095 [Desulfitobacteriaceae bacterium]|nr:hypothetical protein [Desulfitobacteriaceae bacterium]MDD4346828.1 hypothetical protein [Desulfitobacteriaceae bacterium]MDD4402152.1 hypothetical protein [Desulfitobacteriaceae bacterium]